MLSVEENDLLTLIDNDAPMALLMRQHWTPVCLSEEVGEPDGKPLRVEAVGRKYVCFRDSDGRLGLLDELCPHRKASLVYGRNEECGLRCLYHGWKFDVDGNCVAMASEPEESPLHGKVKHQSYRTQEWGGFVWAWLDNGREAPEFEPPAFAPEENTEVAILKIRVPANWAQITEGQIDSAHSSSLHSSDMKPARVKVPLPMRNRGIAPLLTSRLKCKRRRPRMAFITQQFASRSKTLVRITICVSPNISPLTHH